jgi:hypothetical protein
MKLFISNNAKILWERTTHCVSTCWFSKYDVVQHLFKYFERMVQNNLLSATSDKLPNFFRTIVQSGTPKLKSVHMLSVFSTCAIFAAEWRARGISFLRLHIPLMNIWRHSPIACSQKCNQLNASYLTPAVE